MLRYHDIQRNKRAAPIVPVHASLVAVLVVLLLAACSRHSVEVQARAEGDSFPADERVRFSSRPNDNGTLKILTLNAAHGRKDAFNQLLVSTQKIEQNLTDIADVLVRENADVVALQEADGPSGWSGNFDHAASIAKQAGYPWYYRADHARSWLFRYGTAVLSRWPISETLEYTFKPSPPTFNKGFLLSRMAWKPTAGDDDQVPVDIVSVHLDFSRQKVREQQIAEMAAALLRRDQPIIVLGDFNSDWFSDESVVRELVEKARLTVYQPNADNLHTYPKRGARYDWILISSELEFVSYQVLPDLLSDHLAVVAEIRLKKH